MDVRVDHKANKLAVIRREAQVQRQYFDNHAPLANEIEARWQLDKIEFLLGMLDRG